jgi:hypothetical protein
VECAFYTIHRPILLRQKESYGSMLIMIPKPKHDIYIKSGDRYAKIAWLHEYKDFEVMIGFYGFTGTDPVLAH